MRASHLICCVLVGGSLSACAGKSSSSANAAPDAGGSSEASTGRGPDELTSQISRACAALVRAECQQRASCGPVNQDACLRGVERCSTFFGETTRRKVEQGYLVWDSSRLAACVASPGSYSCSASRFTRSPACRDLVRPNRTVGQTCFPEEAHLNPTSCATGWCPEAAGETGPCPATCQAFRAQGESCGDSDRCDVGLQCSSGICVPPARVGQACGDVACGSGLMCAPQRAGGSACAVQAAAGMACDSDPGCQSGLCLDGTCSVSSALGRRCRATEQCGAGNVCRAVSVEDGSTQQLRCSARAPLGASCEVDEACVLGAVCESSRCVTSAPAAAGGACFRSTCQAGSFCGRTSNTCLAKRSTGATCSREPDHELFGACAAGLHCSLADTCQPIAAPGAACAEASDCPATYACGPLNTCVPQKAWGSSCDTGQECYSGICSARRKICVGYCSP